MAWLQGRLETSLQAHFMFDSVETRAGKGDQGPSLPFRRMELNGSGSPGSRVAPGPRSPMAKLGQHNYLFNPE